MSGHIDLIKQVQEKRQATIAAQKAAGLTLDLLVKVPTHKPRTPPESERKPIAARKEEPVVEEPIVEPELPKIVLPPPKPVVVPAETLQARNAKIQESLRSYFKAISVGEDRLVLTNPLVKASPEEMEQLLAGILGSSLHVSRIEKVRTADSNPDVLFRVHFRA